MKKKRSGSGKAPRDARQHSPPRFHGDMLVVEAIGAHPGAGDVLQALGLPCVRCVVAESETLAQGCAPLGMEVDQVLERLNALDAG